MLWTMDHGPRTMDRFPQRTVRTHDWDVWAPGIRNAQTPAVRHFEQAMSDSKTTDHGSLFPNELNEHPGRMFGLRHMECPNSSCPTFRVSHVGQQDYGPRIALPQRTLRTHDWDVWAPAYGMPKLQLSDISSKPCCGPWTTDHGPWTPDRFSPTNSMNIRAGCLGSGIWNAQTPAVRHFEQAMSDSKTTDHGPRTALPQRTPRTPRTRSDRLYELCPSLATNSVCRSPDQGRISPGIQANERKTLSERGGSDSLRARIAIRERSRAEHPVGKRSRGCRRR